MDLKPERKVPLLMTPVRRYKHGGRWAGATLEVSSVVSGRRASATTECQLVLEVHRMVTTIIALIASHQTTVETSK